MTLTPENIDGLRKQLHTERERITSNIESLKSEFGETLTSETEENGLETHMADQGTSTFLRERDLTIEEHEEALLAEIDAALERIEGGTYGTCEVEDHPIDLDRLEALPWARTCMEHAPA